MSRFIGRLFRYTVQSISGKSESDEDSCEEHNDGELMSTENSVLSEDDQGIDTDSEVVAAIKAVGLDDTVWVPKIQEFLELDSIGLLKHVDWGRFESFLQQVDSSQQSALRDVFVKVSCADSGASPAICRDNRVGVCGSNIAEKSLVVEQNVGSISAKKKEGKSVWPNVMLEEERRNFTESDQTQKTPEKQIVSTNQSIGKEEAEPESSQLDVASVQKEVAEQENCGLDGVFNDNGKQEENTQEHEGDQQQEQDKDTQHESVNQNLDTFADQQQKTEKEDLEEPDNTVFRKDARQDLEEDLKDSQHGDDCKKRCRSTPGFRRRSDRFT